MDAPLLEADGLARRFGGVVALDGYGIRLRPRELVGLIGPNGAGKTTAFNLLTGVLAPTSGAISCAGTQLTGKGPESFAQAGIARTFQNIRLFPQLSVLQNAASGCTMRRGPGSMWVTTLSPSSSALPSTSVPCGNVIARRSRSAS